MRDVSGSWPVMLHKGIPQLVTTCVLGYLRMPLLLLTTNESHPPQSTQFLRINSAPFKENEQSQVKM